MATLKMVIAIVSAQVSLNKTRSMGKDLSVRLNPSLKPVPEIG